MVHVYLIKVHGPRLFPAKKRKEKKMLLSLLRVQIEGEKMEQFSRYREEAIQVLKESLGEKYLLHPSNFVQRKGSGLSSDDNQD